VEPDIIIAIKRTVRYMCRPNYSQRTQPITPSCFLQFMVPVWL